MIFVNIDIPYLRATVTECGLSRCGLSIFACLAANWQLLQRSASEPFLLDIPLDGTKGRFFANLNPATSTPELNTTMWTKDDLKVLRAALTRRPECVISWRGKLAPMLQETSETTRPLLCGRDRRVDFLSDAPPHLVADCRRASGIKPEGHR